jgi:hypothetical protein
VDDLFSPVDLVTSVFGVGDVPVHIGDDDDPVADEIKRATWRRRVDVVANVRSVEPVERPIRYVDVVVDDGTARLCCRFFGRRSIPGLEPGRRVRVAGRVTLHLGRECVCNPAYELVDPPTAGGVASS